ncbi:hydroxysqualene dehydroxylase [Rhodococcus rhodochrous]|uniref:hydroxysqualene dehydroxylase n=1 Tax=Rhodococcus rhodochrous TaxID=1829 RepID=UPI00132EA033|nr:FAD-dependent oxidoreductase [Rhodococcus rhodochrous]QHG82510.1 FAD-binding protein [Rhodococcus rhodochrous]QOH57811.1 FAD-dependent oxidoreductase [Rhodococcus rhodochrous]
MSRRTVLTALGALGAAAALPATASAQPSRRAPAVHSGGRRVAILGGGMAGLAAAHELIERGFEVTVFEPTALGGKARSIPSPGTAAGGRLDLPGEHGFRFFPGFYQHIPDTMRRIPFPGNPNGVFDNLVAGHGFRMAIPGAPDLTAPASIAPLRFDIYDPLSLQESLTAAFSLGGSIPPHELAVFMRKLVMFLTSSLERRNDQWEHETWAQTLEADGKSKGYREILVSALTRQLVAARPQTVSTRTIGIMGQAFVWNAMGTVPQYGHLDRLLSAPTNEAWIDPWAQLLRDLGVKFEMGWAAEALEISGGRITGARVVDGSGNRARAEADWFVAAMPAERAVSLWSPEILAVDPGLERMNALVTDWMVGIQYFLRRPTPITPGHVAYLGSPWALTSISQAQFWRGDFARRYGDGSAHDCLSVDIADWDTPGILYGRTAKQCTPEEIAREVWAQMSACLEDGTGAIDENDIVSWFLDPGVRWGAGGITNDTPLLINTAGSLANRPEAHTAIPNLFLAGDYVRNDIDLATMEGANESARAAVGALLQTAGSPAAPPALYKLHEPPELEPLRRIDADRYRAGQPHMLA